MGVRIPLGRPISARVPLLVRNPVVPLRNGAVRATGERIYRVCADRLHVRKLLGMETAQDSTQSEVEAPSAEAGILRR